MESIQILTAHSREGSISSAIDFNTWDDLLNIGLLGARAQMGTFAGVMAHETVHGFGLRHTYCESSWDNRSSRGTNLMNRIDRTARFDIDLLQLDVIQASTFFSPSVRGDADGDGRIAISDLIRLSGYLYSGGGAPDFLEQGDANGGVCQSGVLSEREPSALGGPLQDQQFRDYQGGAHHVA